MAQFPQGYRSIDACCNAGERRVLQQLTRCLDDDYLIWHDLPVGPQARRPDFVILSPRWGVLLLQVKDWRHSTLASADPHVVQLDTAHGRVSAANPLRQVGDAALELIEQMQRDPALVHADGAFAGKLLFPYGWGVAFASLGRDELAGSAARAVFAEHCVLLREDLDETLAPAAFRQRLWGLFTMHYPHTLTPAQRDRVRWHLFADLRLQPLQEDPAGTAATGPARQSDRDPLPVMDLQQEQIARSLGDGHHVIHGPAGSGKTQILIHHALQLAATASAGHPVLVLCCNPALAEGIEARLRQHGVGERVQVRTFHQWCQDMVGMHRLDVPVHASGEAYHEALARTVERAVEQGRVPAGQYAALLIDEAHDFEDTWLRMAVRLLDPATQRLLVLYDDTQSIHQKKRRKFSLAGVGIQARGRTSVLTLNHRNTAEVLSLALHCAHGLLDSHALAAPAPGTIQAQDLALAPRLLAIDTITETDIGDLATSDQVDDSLCRVRPASAGRSGPQPVLVQARHGVDEARLVGQRIVAALATGVPASQIGVLCRARYLLRPIEQELARLGVACQSVNAQGLRPVERRSDAVCLHTLHSAKGLEFSLCCVVGLQALPLQGEPLDEALRLVYVGMTRARHELLLSAHGSSPVVERVRLGMAALQQPSGLPVEADAALVSQF